MQLQADKIVLSAVNLNYTSQVKKLSRDLGQLLHAQLKQPAKRQPAFRSSFFVDHMMGMMLIRLLSKGLRSSWNLKLVDAKPQSSYETAATDVSGDESSSPIYKKTTNPRNLWYSLRTSLRWCKCGQSPKSSSIRFSLYYSGPSNRRGRWGGAIKFK